MPVAAALPGLRRPFDPTKPFPVQIDSTCGGNDVVIVAAATAGLPRAWPPGAKAEEAGKEISVCLSRRLRVGAHYPVRRGLRSRAPSTSCSRLDRSWAGAADHVRGPRRLVFFLSETARSDAESFRPPPPKKKMNPPKTPPPKTQTMHPRLLISLGTCSLAGRQAESRSWRSTPGSRADVIIEATSSAAADRDKGGRANGHPSKRLPRGHGAGAPVNDVRRSCRGHLGSAAEALRPRREADPQPRDRQQGNLDVDPARARAGLVVHGAGCRSTSARHAAARFGYSREPLCSSA